MRKQNHYENAFQSWLIENKVQHIDIDQSKRALFHRNKIKSFDFLIYTQSEVLIVEVKGRKFKGDSLAGLKGLQNWVTTEDIQGLIAWENSFGQGYKGVFVFAYCLEKPFVDKDGLEIYEFDSRRYFFFLIDLASYQQNMKQRSPRWKTVNLSSENFRKYIKHMDCLLS